MPITADDILVPPGLAPLPGAKISDSPPVNGTLVPPAFFDWRSYERGITQIPLFTDQFNSETLGAVPSLWTREAGVGAWTVIAAPTGMTPGRSLQGVTGAADNFLRVAFARQVDRELTISYKLRTGSSIVATARSGDLQVFDTTGAYVMRLIPYQGNWQIGNSSGHNLALPGATAAASTTYSLIIRIDLDELTYTVQIGSTIYSLDAGNPFALTTGTTGIDRIKFSLFSAIANTFAVDDVAVTRIIPPVPTPTSPGILYEAPGTFDGSPLGVDKFGRVTFGYENADPLATTVMIERSQDAVTWDDVTGLCTITETTPDRWTVIDRRPHYGSQAAAYGGAAYYRLSGANYVGDDGPSTESAQVTAIDVDIPTIEADRFPVLSAYMAGAAVPSSLTDEVYPSTWLLAMSYAYFKTGVSQYLTDCSNQFAYMQTLDANAAGIVQFPDFATFYYRDHHWRSIYHAAIAARLLRQTGDAGAISLAGSLITQADTWVTNFNTLNSGSPWGSITRSGWDANNQTATNYQLVWTATTQLTLGDIRRPTVNNLRTYRVTAVTTGITAGSQPTWPTTDGGAVVDGGVTWTETTVTAPCTWGTYSETAPYTAEAAAARGDINQIAEEAAAAALLLVDPASSASSAGALRTQLLQNIADTTALLSTYETSVGGIPVGDPRPAAGGTVQDYDTLYGAYVLESVATILRLGETSTANRWMTHYLQNGAAWLNGALFTTEPLIHQRYSGAASPIEYQEITLRALPIVHAGLSWTTMLKLLYSAAFQSFDETIGSYDAEGLPAGIFDGWQSRMFHASPLMALDLTPPRNPVPMMAPMVPA